MKSLYHASQTLLSRSLLLLILLLGGSPTIVLVGKEPRVTKVSSIPVQWRRNAVLEDVCQNGLVLFDAMGIPNQEPNLLLLWDLDRGKHAFQVTMDAWEKHGSVLREGGLPGSEGPFRCLDGGKRVVALQGMYLVLINVEKPEEVAWVLPSSDLNDVSPPQLTHGVGHLISATLDVNPVNGLIAAAFNSGLKPRLFLYAADLKNVVRTWEMPQFMQDIRWSPDGEKLAVLRGKSTPTGNLRRQIRISNPRAYPTLRSLTRRPAKGCLNSPAATGRLRLPSARMERAFVR